MTLRIRRLREDHRTRICLAGELRCAHLSNLRTEITGLERPAALDLEEVSVVDIEGIRFLNECQTQDIAVENCSPYIRQWMIQEKRADRIEEE